MQHWTTCNNIQIEQWKRPNQITDSARVWTNVGLGRPKDKSYYSHIIAYCNTINDLALDYGMKVTRVRKDLLVLFSPVYLLVSTRLYPAVHFLVI